MILNKDKSAKSKIFITFLIVFMSLCSYALPTDREQILYLRSDSADISQEKHLGTFVGHVEIDQGSTHLRSASAKTKGDAKNTLVKAVVLGDADQQAHYWSLLTQDKPILHAYADKIYYYPEKHIIKLVGRAKISQGDNTFSAPKIIYDTVKQHVLTKRTKNQRTTITIYPEKHT